MHLLTLLGDVGHVESRFGLFGDSVSSVHHRCMVCAKHTIGSEIILDAPDGSTRTRVSSGSLFRSIWR
jgi:hypothetical protein